jgi:hypothetical protein
MQIMIAKKENNPLRFVSSLITTACFVGCAALVSGCDSPLSSGSSASVDSLSSSASSSLGISSSTSTVAINGNVVFTASGGTKPYTYYLESGEGTINSSTGLFTASAIPGSVEVMVEDAAGNTSYSTITVGDAQDLTLTAAAYQIAPNATVQLTPSGGTAPYSYYVVSGDGSVSSSGVFTAPDYETTSEIEVVDKTGYYGTVSIEIVSTALSLNVASLTVTNGEAITLTTNGGVAPYTYKLISGGGSISGSVYTAPEYVSSVEIQVTDADDNTGTSTFNVVASGVTGQFVSATSNSIANSLWEPSNLFLGSTTSCYRSITYSSATPSVEPYIIAYLGNATTKVKGYYTVNHLNLTAYYDYNKLSGFPASYTVQILDAITNAWVSVGTYTTQPSFDGVVRLTFGTSYVTNEVAVVPTTLTTDTGGNHCFQLCGISQ